MLILKGEIGDGDVVVVDVDDRGNAVFHKKGGKRRAAAS